jgi:hypothetical protein
MLPPYFKNGVLGMEIYKNFYKVGKWKWVFKIKIMGLNLKYVFKMDYVGVWLVRVGLVFALTIRTILRLVIVWLC